MLNTGSRAYQRACLVWRKRHGTRPDRQRTQAAYTNVHRDHRAPHEGPSRPIHILFAHCISHTQPENQHVKFNIDVKVQNDPDRLFSLMHKIISAQPDWETKLAPRLLLGLWHPRFLSFAKANLPYCRRSYIGNSPYIARRYFWNNVDVFSMAFPALTTTDGYR